MSQPIESPPHLEESAPQSDGPQNLVRFQTYRPKYELRVRKVTGSAVTADDQCHSFAASCSFAGEHTFCCQHSSPQSGNPRPFLCIKLLVHAFLCCVTLSLPVFFLCSLESSPLQQGMPLSRSNRRGTGPVQAEDLQLAQHHKSDLLSLGSSSRNGLSSTINRTYLTFNRPDSRIGTTVPTPTDKSQSAPPAPSPTVCL